MRVRARLIAASLALLLAAPALAVDLLPTTAHYYPLEARAEVDAAVAEAQAGGRLAVLVFGADWCSDSRALAAFLKSDMFQVELGKRYNVVFIDVYMPTRGAGRNQDLIQRFGIDKMTGTPEVLVIGKDGKPINSIENAHSWRDAGDRSILSIYRWFRDLEKPRG